MLPPPNEDHKILQIYFVGDSATELDKRCAIFNATNHEIIAQLFKIALDTMYTDDHKIVIRAEKNPQEVMQGNSMLRL